MARLRVTVEEPCVHGIHDRHPVDDVTEWSTARAWCPGGSRRVLDPGSYLLVEKVDGEWPEWALHAAGPFKVFTASDGYPAVAAREDSEILDALAEGEQ